LVPVLLLGPPLSAVNTNSTSHRSPNENPSSEQLARFLQNCTHEASILRKVYWGGVAREIPPVMILANSEDDYYSQSFRNRSELNAFIDHLQSVANELWPHEGDSSIVAESTIPAPTHGALS